MSISYDENNFDHSEDDEVRTSSRASRKSQMGLSSQDFSRSNSKVTGQANPYSCVNGLKAAGIFASAPVLYRYYSVMNLSLFVGAAALLLISTKFLEEMYLQAARSNKHVVVENHTIDVGALPQEKKASWTKLFLSEILVLPVLACLPMVQGEVLGYQLISQSVVMMLAAITVGILLPKQIDYTFKAGDSNPVVIQDKHNRINNQEGYFTKREDSVKETLPYTTPISTLALFPLLNHFMPQNNLAMTAGCYALYAFVLTCALPSLLIAAAKHFDAKERSDQLRRSPSFPAS